MIRHTGTELYVLSVLAQQASGESDSIHELLRTGELRITKKSKVIEKVASGVVFALAGLAAVVVVAILAGLAKNLLFLIW